MVFFEIDGKVHWWLGGTCRSCGSLHIHCQGCGNKGIATSEIDYVCNCPYLWKSNNGSLEIYEYHSENGDDDYEFIDPNQLKFDF